MAKSVARRCDCVFDWIGKMTKANDDKREAFAERAAIIQFSSGLPSMTREQAEKIAAEQMGLTEDDAEFLMGAKE